MKTERRYDVVVVGAGTAGSGAAYQLARVGFRVALVDRKPMTQAGPGWTNNVQAWLFKAADIALPTAPELRSDGAAALFVTKTDHVCFRLEPTPFMAVDMRLLCDRLHALAEGAGADMVDNADVEGLSFDNKRPSALHLRHRLPDGSHERLTLYARLFVDATGLPGALRQRHPVLSRHCPPTPPERICFATQQTLAIADRKGAQAYLDRYQGRSGDVVSFFGVEGGFSTVNLRVDLVNNEAEILCGSMDTHVGGPAILTALLEHEPWIGKAHAGGAARIPIRRAYDRLSAPGMALIGDAACQVLPAHGSGIGMGLAAGKLLAEALTGATDPGDEARLWRYQANFQRRYGAILAAYDLVSRMSQQMSGENIDRLMSSGLISDWSMWWGMEERLPEPKLKEILGLLASSTREPALALKVAPRLAPLPLVVACYKRYPEYPDFGALKRWSASVARLFGDSPEVD